MDEDYMMLNERQQQQAEDLAELALKFGMFNQGTGADGAHYAPQNPFVADGIACKNCVFYNEEAQQCQIVEGIIEPDAVCKLWVIPEMLLAGIAEDRAALKLAKAKLLTHEQNSFTAGVRF